MLPHTRHSNYRPHVDFYLTKSQCQDLTPATHCSLKFKKCKFCTRDFCFEHGQYQRTKDCNKILDLGTPKSNCYIFVGNINYCVTPKMLSYIRNTFFRLLKEKYKNVGICWRWEWRNFIPHLNATILYYTSPENSYLKLCWERALKLAKHPQPSQPRIYFKRCQNYVKWTQYMFKVCQRLGKTDAPPRAFMQRYSYFAVNNDYKTYLTPNEYTTQELELQRIMY